MNKSGLFVIKRCILKENVSCDRKDRIKSFYSDKNIFINIPYLPSYKKFENAICATVALYNFNPVLARWYKKPGERLCKIHELILSCKHGIVDISRPQLQNMPFEFGVLSAYGKKTVLLSKRKYEFIELFSDMRLVDPEVYGAKYSDKMLDNIMGKLSTWIHQVLKNSRGKQYSPSELRKVYELFSEGIADENNTPLDFVKYFRASIRKTLKNADQVTFDFLELR